MVVAMLRKCSLFSALVFCGMQTVTADTIQLKEKAAITGKILSEKRDQIAVDVGYTVLVIPRNQIAKILKTDEVELPTKVVTKPAMPVEVKDLIESKPGFYSAPKKHAQIRNVRDLVNLIVEAVVQVRTPSGLGSGFIINEDGYLITNFHVIEGETQISVEVYHLKDDQLERKVYKQVRIVAMNKFQDLALLRIDEKEAPKFAKVALGDSDPLAVGEKVFAIGSPLGLERTVTEGIVSTKT